MNTWDEIGASFEGPATRKAPRAETANYPSLRRNQDYQRMLRDHEREFEDAIEYDVQRQRGGE